MPGALTGLRVIDLTQNLGGPYCSMILADHGADVIKVEPPGGEELRSVPPMTEGQSGPFMMWNRNKRSISLDLKIPDDLTTLLELLGKADVVLESARPGAMARLGLDWESLRLLFPRLVMGSLSGYGQTGPLATLGGFDVVAQGISGLMSINGPVDGPPHRLPIPICDLTSGMNLAIGILAAIEARHRTGRGQYVETSLLEAAVSLQVYEAAHYFTNGSNPPRMGQAHRGIAPYQVFESVDGFVTIGAGQTRFYEDFCHLAELPELIADPRFSSIEGRLQNKEALIGLLSAATRKRSTDWWVEKLTERSVPCGPVFNHAEMFSHPQILARQMVAHIVHPKAGDVRTLGIPVKLSDTPGSVRLPAPMLNEHSEEIRRELRRAVG